MHDFSSIVAIATLSSRVLESRDMPSTRAGVVAALKVTGDPDDLAFAMHVHVPTSALLLTRWIDGLVGDDPMLIGYRLGRTSRLLRGAGYLQNLAATFSQTGRYDVLELVRGTPAPLSVTALIHGIMAVDEEALLSARPVTPDVAANLAVINAVASWVIYVGRNTPGKGGSYARRRALDQLGAALSQTHAYGLLAATITGSVQ